MNIITLPLVFNNPSLPVFRCCPMASDVSVTDARKNKLEKMHRTNKRLLKKIRKTSEFLKSLNEGEISATPATLDVVSPKGTLESIQELSPGHFVLHLSTIKDEPKEHVITSQLSKNLPTNESYQLQGEILQAVSRWSRLSYNHKTVIKLLEAYKSSVKSQIQSKKEDPYTRLYHELHKLRDETKAEGKKVPFYFPWPFKNRCHLPTNQKDLIKEYVKSLGGKESPWMQSEYFSRIPKTIIDCFREINEQSCKDGEIPFLSLYAVNRLTAIAKMLNYCQDSRIDVQQFQQGRTKQKIAALQSRRKSFLEEQRIFHTENSIIEESFFSLEELDYLLNLNLSKLDQIIDSLKSTLLSSSNGEMKDEIMIRENLLETCLRQRHEKTEVLIQKISSETNQVGESISDEIIREYLEIVPRMMKKRERKMVEEQRILKKMELEKPQVTVKTGTNDVENGSRDDSTKTLPNPPTDKKLVFKITIPYKNDLTFQSYEDIHGSY